MILPCCQAEDDSERSIVSSHKVFGVSADINVQVLLTALTPNNQSKKEVQTLFSSQKLYQNLTDLRKAYFVFARFHFDKI